jgi:hypothetical protein
MKRIRIPITTATDGSATAYGDAAVGVLYAVQLVDGTLADGVDLTLTCETDDLSMPLLSYANFNADGMAYPRVLESLNTDGTALSTHCMPAVYGRPKAVIASGGSVASGAVVLFVIEM